MTVDQIKESEDSRIWEEQNADDSRKEKAGNLMAKAYARMQAATKHLASAAEAIAGLPDENRILSVKDALDDLAWEIGKLVGRYV